MFKLDHDPNLLRTWSSLGIKCFQTQVTQFVPNSPRWIWDMIDAVPLGTIQFSKQLFCKIPGVFYALCSVYGKPNLANLS
jgi:hypothetical protein